jgi:hypothetical protein
VDATIAAGREQTKRYRLLIPEHSLMALAARTAHPDVGDGWKAASGFARTGGTLMLALETKANLQLFNSDQRCP